MKKIISLLLIFSMISMGAVTFAADDPNYIEYTENFEQYNEGDVNGISGFRALTDSEKSELRARYGNAALGPNEQTGEPTVATLNGEKVLKFEHTTNNPRKRPAVIYDFAETLTGVVTLSFDIVLNQDTTDSKATNLKMPLEIYNDDNEIVSMILLDNSDGDPKKQMRVVEGEDQTYNTGTIVFDWQGRKAGDRIKFKVEIDPEARKQRIYVYDTDNTLLNKDGKTEFDLYRDTDNFNISKFLLYELYYEGLNVYLDNFTLSGTKLNISSDDAITGIRNQISEKTTSEEINEIISNPKNKEILSTIQSGFSELTTEQLSLLAWKLYALGVSYSGNDEFITKFQEAYKYASEYQEGSNTEIVNVDFTNMHDSVGEQSGGFRELTDDELETFRGRFSVSTVAADVNKTPVISDNGSKTGLAFIYKHNGQSDRERSSAIMDLPNALKGLITVRLGISMPQNASNNFKMPVELQNSDGKTVAAIFISNTDGSNKQKVVLPDPSAQGTEVIQNEGMAIYSWPSNVSNKQYTLEFSVNTVEKKITANVYDSTGALQGSGTADICGNPSDLKIKKLLVGLIYAGTSVVGSEYTYFIDNVTVSQKDVVDPIEEEFKALMNEVNASQNQNASQALANHKVIISSFAPLINTLTDDQLNYLGKDIYAQYNDIETLKEKIISEIGLNIINYSTDNELIDKIIFEEYKDNVNVEQFITDINNIDKCKETVLTRITENRPYDTYDEVTEIIGETVAVEGVNFLLYTGIPDFIKRYARYLNVSQSHTFFSMNNLHSSIALEIKKYTPISSAAEFLPILNKAIAAVNKSQNVGGWSSIDTVIRGEKGNNGNSSLPSGLFTEQTNPIDLGFKDLGETEWAREAIVYLWKKGIVSGRDDDNFAPNDNIKREELVKIIVEAFNISTENAECDFEDVPNDSWAYPYIAAAVQAGVVTGIGDGKFNMGAEITRQDLAVILYRICSTRGLISDEQESEMFEDTDACADYAVEAVSALKNSGYITGNNNRFYPKDPCTRAEAATMIYRIIKEIN